jgi:Purple acid Phosphatase, N-terminal domain/Calcineurin-like phosphoesterase
MSDDAEPGLSRRQLLAAGTTGLIATAAVPPAAGPNRRRAGPADGTPEQIHLTWGDDPARSVVVSWASPGQAVAPRVRIGQRVIPAVERGYADPRGDELVWTYHALVDGLRPGATYGYAVTADNDRNAADPFSATFRTAPEGRAAFRFTSFGDLTAPNARWAGSSGPSAYAVGAVETFQPLFHLLNGDLADAEPNPGARPRAWRDFANNVQASAANRPWLPVPGSHGAEPADRDRALRSYLARYSLPGNGVPGFEGRWYAFRVGTAAFLCLSGDDVRRGYSGGAQTRWLEAALAAARRDASIDWLVIQVHQCACSSARSGDDALSLRQQWLPLFDRYEVDLVLCGHSRGYERSFPVRGFDSADTCCPRPVTTVDSGVFDTSQGTVHLVLGGGDGDADGAVAAEAGGAGAGDVAGGDVAGGDASDAGGAVAADAAWSARRYAGTGYGVAVFDVNPGAEAGAQTSITIRYYHAVDVDPGAGPGDGPADDYALFDTFTLVRPRSDGRRWHPRESVASTLA